VASGLARSGVLLVNPPGEENMMNRIRTRIESARANNQLQSYYLWRPAPGRR
jgi:hypothetical protein